jgi:hypothetical protein
MKAILAAVVTLFSLNASAIVFITEDQVQETLQAEKVIEIGKYEIQAKLVEKGTECERSTFSKSARAYVVKKEGKAHIVVTPSDLEGLQYCGEL